MSRPLPSVESDLLNLFPFALLPSPPRILRDLKKGIEVYDVTYSNVTTTLTATQPVASDAIETFIATMTLIHDNA